MRLHKIIFSSFVSAIFLLASCRHPAEVTGVDVQYVEMNKQANLHDSATEAMIRPYKDSLDKLMNVIVGHTDVAMPKERDKMETLLGNFVADICLTETNKQYATDGSYYHAQLCLLNTGGLRSSLPKGDLTRGNIFELMPFDNEIVVLTLSGNQMRELLRFVAKSGGEPIAGMKMGVKPDKTPGTVLIDGQAFDSTKTYTVVTSDYLANGGDKMDFFKSPLKSVTPGLKIRDAILDYCMQQSAAGRSITPKLDGRLYYETN